MNNAPFERFGVMIDCSRNAVMTVENVKSYITLISRLGYNMLMLYTEDTYEISNRPLFGYLRGRYSKHELKQLDAFAKEQGVELVPCIQTLAHLQSLTYWNDFRDFFDCDDILLCGDERSYKLIEDMFATLAECFSSRIVNIGMDEAYMVGLGKYLQQHGYQSKFDILSAHLTRIKQIADRYGFSPIMWSDMFFRAATGGGYAENVTFDKSAVEKVPDGIGLIYWDYYNDSREHYLNLLRSHAQFNNELWFAGGLWCWNGLAPRNGHSIANTRAAISACAEQGVRNVFMTLWGDNGAECSPYTVLPSLYYAAQLARGVDDEQEIKRGFEREFNIPFDEFMQLDLPMTAGNPPTAASSQEKYMLYSDPFLGFFDVTVPSDFKSRYLECAKRLSAYESDPRFGYLFTHYRRLCELLDLKYTLGVKTRQVYDSKDMSRLPELIALYDETIVRTQAFYEAFRQLWFTENKPHGFDVQELRLGGLLLRLKSCRERLERYMNGELDKIEELDELLVPEAFDNFGYKGCGLHYYNNWRRNASVNEI